MNRCQAASKERLTRTLKGEPVGIVTVRCPETGQQVSTGLIMEPEAFAAATLGVRVFVCDACGETHVWEKSDATVSAESGP